MEENTQDITNDKQQDILKSAVVEPSNDVTDSQQQEEVKQQVTDEITAKPTSESQQQQQQQQTATNDQEQNQTQDFEKTFSKKQSSIKQVMSQPESSIKVCISDPIQKDGSMGKYIVYKVSGEDREGTFEQYRRFNDFFVFRSVLVTRWPACYIPPTPPKKAVGNMDQQFIEDRRNLLDIFMKKLSYFEHIWYSDEVKIFTRSTASDIDRLLQNLPKQDHTMLIKKYEESFKQLSGKEINTELIIKINSFSAYLKKISPMLENYKTMAQNMVNQRKLLNEQFFTFSSFLMPDYEKNCQQEYSQNLQDNQGIFNINNQKLLEFNSKLKEFSTQSEFESLYQLIRFELKEVEAFQEAMKAKEEYENLKLKAQQKHKDLQIELQKVMAGKTTVKTFFSSKSKEESAQSLQTQIDNASKEIESLTLICDIMTVILGYIEIDNFKCEKEQKYYNVIRKLSQYEAEYSKMQIEFWNTIIEDPHISGL